VAPRSTLLAAALALAFVALHLPYTARSLEDVDSINFALGLRDFDVAEHQPHPPGYPVFMLIANAVQAVIPSETTALSVLGIISGALSAFALVPLAGALDGRTGVPWTVWGSALLMLTAPLMWLTAARPLSDVPGLAAALLIQWLILRTSSQEVGRTFRSAWQPTLLAAALVAGIGAGIRSQVVWLTAPLLMLTVARQPELRNARTALTIAAAYGVGVLLWAVPLLVAAGGPAAYLNALAAQGGEDFAGVRMLWTTPTVRQLAVAIEHTFLSPWGWWPLAGIVLVAAAIGSVRLVMARPQAVAALAVTFGPYLVFTMLFQETVTTRYALPLVVPIAFLAVQGLALLPARFAVAAVAGLAAVALAIGHSSLVAYASQEAPAFRMLADMRMSFPEESPVLATHRRLALDLRRPLRWLEPEGPAFAAHLPAPPRYEWLELVKYWNSGRRGLVWFAADPLRSDLALVHHDGPRASYRWPLRFHALIGGVRPGEIDWYHISDPAWYLGEGWALTPETAGLAALAERGPGAGGSLGWIRRTAGPATLMIGGRLLPGGAGAARLRVSLDGRVADEAEITPGFFLRFIQLPAGALDGEGSYAAMAIASENDRVALEQFDAQPAAHLVYGFGEGWHEREYDPSTGESWRWTSDRAAIRIHGAGKPLAIRIRGESEAGRDVTLTIRSGDRVLLTETVGATFVVNATVPAAALEPEPVISIETDGAFVPAEVRWRSQDRRRLGLKIYECRLTPAS
jgi:hypothetical protein